MSTAEAGRNPEVDAWFDAYDNPQKDLVQAVREAVLEADPRIGEAIKWKAPTFVYRGNLARSTEATSPAFTPRRRPMRR